MEPKGFDRFNGSSFWKSLQRNVKKHMGCFRVVAGRPKDAKRALPIKPAGNATGCCSVKNSEEHEEKLKALKHMGCFRVVAGRPKDAKRALPIKPAGNATGCCSVKNSEEHEEKLKALILYCKNSYYSQG